MKQEVCSRDRLYTNNILKKIWNVWVGYINFNEQTDKMFYLEQIHYISATTNNNVDIVM